MLVFLPLIGFFVSTQPAPAEANVAADADFRAVEPSRQWDAANCTVGNATYAHGRTFKLDCRTQCVCENGRHACSSLCPKEQLPAPEDTISCRSPRLVDVPGHCCKMWLCENPTADVTATCHNSSASPWTPCSHRCGAGLSTRATSATRGCRRPSNVRLCENQPCAASQEPPSRKRNQVSGSSQQLQLDANRKQLKFVKDASRHKSEDAPQLGRHRIRKGHECRHVQRLGPARIRLGPCVSKKLYRPKLCGSCQHSSKCCVPSVSTTIQVELLCPLKTLNPVSYVEQSHQRRQQLRLWDTVSLEPLDQEFLQSHQMQIENKFVAVEWILKCECGRNARCSTRHYGGNDAIAETSSNNRSSNTASTAHRTRSGIFADAAPHKFNYKRPLHVYNNYYANNDNKNINNNIRKAPPQPRGLTERT